MNKKGFTLIELLAILVIIGIVALITVTSITTLLKNYKTQIYNKQIDNIEAAARVWGADHLLILPNDSTSVNVCYYDNINNCPTNYKKLIIDLQTLQNSGTIDKDLKNPKTKEPFENVTIEIVKNGNIMEYNVITEEENNQSSSGSTYAAYSIGQSINYNPVSGELCDSPTSTPGTKTGCMKWYVIKESGTSDETVDVILDHNTTATVAWANNTDYLEAGGTQADWDAGNVNMKGPVTANKQLVTDTAGWTAGLNSRLITADEVAHITGADTEINWTAATKTTLNWYCFDTNEVDTTNWCARSQGASNYKWLFDYINGCTSYGCDTADSSTLGYWTSSSVFDDIYMAWYVGKGRINFANASINNKSGIRPVITISKSALQ